MQDPDGSWNGQGGRPADAAFSIMFLSRATKKSLQIDAAPQGLGVGTLVGGTGLPKNAEEFERRQQRSKPRALVGPAEELLQIMQDPNSPDQTAAIEAVTELKIAPDDATLSQRDATLRKLLKGDSTEARAAVVKALARSRNLDYVPLLIYALGDPDGVVVEEAYHGLRFVSRQFLGAASSPPAEEAERAAAIRHFKDWYLSIRPTAVFEE
jgi:hypothetical protein